ncbi:syntaxin-2-like [Myxocyprinus asiaticus]|uniref:syntaxin-2-like n=1 Tax=Myxocyprinus asiaticus TaxID=70543 RepID=UPI002223BB10|nr:syntaxin-2-like [Myxocyprinus asiaticus]
MKDRLADLTAICCDISAPVESNAFLEEFLPKVDEVQKGIERISYCVGEVRLRHGTILTEIKPPDYLREELEQFNRDIKKTADVIQIKLKDLEGSFAQNVNANSGSVYCRILRTQHTVLSLRFAEIMNMYNQELISFRKRSKERIQRQLDISGRVVSEEETEALLQSNNPSVFTSDMLSDSCITWQALNEIESRHKDILCLEASIRELHNLFMDIVVLVNSQGEMANNIAKTVMKAENYVDQGKGNIANAVVYKHSWRIRLPPLCSSFKSKAKPVTSDLS